MVTTERRASKPTANDGYITCVAGDYGNTNVKFAIAGHEQVHKFPSFIYEVDPDTVILEDIYECLDDSSALVEYNGEIFLIGALAAMYGGDPIYKRGKARSMVPMFMATLRGIEAISSCPVIERLNILVPDALPRAIESTWQVVADEIESITEFSVNGALIRPQIRKVKFISEGVPAFRLCKEQGLFSDYANTPGISEFGILDIGGGDTTLKIFDYRTGQIDWNRAITLDRLGVAALAQSIAHRIKAAWGLLGTPDTTDILRGLSIQHYVYGNESYEDIYLKCREKWAEAICKELIPSIGESLGTVAIVGGGAYHAEDFETYTNSRFFIASEDLTEVDPQKINAIALTEM
ncbi:hypothetical protein Lepto7375DRAFT_7217 [Leptolyngbya sp. PCC 7375]|nr:hypothetical protein Lepto7375DRAFT_7217 [Leptolyngbya sp. PCC 7375]